ncbi:transporter substrate-binding domain-containing protein [Roseburia hominis]
MNRNTFFKLVLSPFLLLLCSILFLPTVVSAATTEPGAATINLSAEELAYCERAGELVIGCPTENCPLLFQDEKTGQLKGITIDILDMISEATGLTFRYQALPSGSITYKDLQTLQVDMLAGVEFNEVNKHATGIALTDAYLHAEKVFVCRKGVVFQPDSSMTIAVSTGSQTLAKTIQQQYPKFQILFCDSTEDALSTLLSGKADAVLQNQYTIERILCKPVYEDLQIVAPSLHRRQPVPCEPRAD